jgi:hypothetical protein
MQFFVAAFDGAFVCKFAQQAFEFRPHCILKTEGAGNFASADLARPLADEGENVSLGWKKWLFLGWFVQNV